MENETNQQLSSQQPIPTSSSPSHSNIVPMILVGVAMALVGLGGGYLLFANMNQNTSPTLNSITQTVSPTITQKAIPTTNVSPENSITADWKTHTSSQYRYTIKYPSNISFKQDKFYFTGDDNRKDTADGFGPNLSILYRGNDITPAEAAKNELAVGYPSIKDITINNATGVQIIGPGLNAFDYYLKPISGKNVFRVTFSSQDYSPTVPKDKIQEMEQIATQMLSTFSFSD